jgi:hypothetical protein
MQNNSLQNIERAIESVAHAIRQDGLGSYAGAVVKMQGEGYSAVATTTGLIPFDDTIPQITEGGEFMSFEYTPRDAANTLFIEVVVWLSVSIASSNPTAALFKVGQSDALAANTVHQSVSTGRNNIKLMHEMLAGQTTAITFKVRAGNDAAATTSFNGNSGTRVYGATTKSFIRVTEVIS